MPKKTTRQSLRKLVRDKVPDEIAGEGRSFRKVEILGSLKDLLLRRKAVEEVFELCRAQNLENLKEEIADVFEILHALAAEHKLSLDEVESIRIAKRLARGGFEKGIFIDYVGPSTPPSEMGLFGPMDYVAVTRRTPRVSEIRIDEEQLLRIPLVPSMRQEEFRVGNYAVTYTEREVLVRIVAEKNEDQLVLFPCDPESYDLTDPSLNFPLLLERFEGFWKVYSNVLLKAHKFPIPESLILFRLNPDTLERLSNFCGRRGYKYFLLRHDREPELAHPPRGGFLVALRNAARELAPFFLQDRLLMLQEPLSPYEDMYSCNACLSKYSTVVHLEIVGPGFDASDLNRGDVTPHESWDIDCDPGSDRSLSTAKRTQLVDEQAYRHSVRSRLLKVGKRISGEFAIERLGAGAVATEGSADSEGQASLETDRPDAASRS